jgi:hypothetical protein
MHTLYMSFKLYLQPLGETTGQSGEEEGLSIAGKTFSNHASNPLLKFTSRQSP